VEDDSAPGGNLRLVILRWHAGHYSGLPVAALRGPHQPFQSRHGGVQSLISGDTVGVRAGDWHGFQVREVTDHANP